MSDYIKWGMKLLPVAVGFVAGILLTIFVGDISGQAVEAQPIGADFILTLVQLVALILPALAIALQAVMGFSRRPAMELGGGGTQMRYTALLTSGGSGFFLFVATFIALNKLELPRDLRIASGLILLAIAMFAFMLLSAGISGWSRRDLDEELSSIDAIHELSKIDEIPQSEREHLLTEYPDLRRATDKADDSD